MIHPHPPPLAPIRRERRTMGDNVKAEVKMKVEDLVVAKLLSQTTTQMAGATTVLPTPCPTTATANPLHPGVTADIMPLRDILKGVSAQHTTPRSNRRTWC